MASNITENDFQLSAQDLNSIAEDTSQQIVIQSNISLTQIRMIIEKDLGIINSIIASNGEGVNKDTEEALILSVFQDLVRLREFFTGQKSVLQVGTARGTITKSLDNLFQKQGGYFSIHNQKIQWHITDIKKNINTIDGYTKSLQNLYSKLFTVSNVAPPKSADDSEYFEYQHSSGTSNTGRFWNGNYFAAYKNRAIQHYFIQAKQKNPYIYNASNAKYYNKGHVYEWYLTEINKREDSGKYDPQPIAFMNKYANTKDSIRFIQAGDYTKIEDGIIQAVQVKRINNKKLIDYKQIQSSFIQLKSLIDPNLSKTRFKEVVISAFTSGDRVLDKGALSKINEVVDVLFQK